MEFPDGEQTRMEIGPIPGVRIAPMIRSRETDLGLTDVYEIERSSRMGDETYSHSGSKAATGFEDDDLEESADAEAREQHTAGNGKIDYIA